MKSNPSTTLTNINQIFKNWVNWYNTEKPHHNLTGNSSPVKRFFETEGCIFHPLKAKVNWDSWLHEVEQKKVNKYHEIHCKSQKFHIPPSYSGTKIEVIEYEDKIEIYYREHLLIIHPYNVLILS